MNELRKHREQAGLSQHELARATGLSQATISKLEAGEGTPRRATRQAINRVLGHTTKEENR